MVQRNFQINIVLTLTTVFPYELFIMFVRQNGHIFEEYLKFLSLRKINRFKTPMHKKFFFSKTKHRLIHYCNKLPNEISSLITSSMFLQKKYIRSLR